MTTRKIQTKMTSNGCCCCSANRSSHTDHQMSQPEDAASTPALPFSCRLQCRAHFCSRSNIRQLAISVITAQWLPAWTLGSHCPNGQMGTRGTTSRMPGTITVLLVTTRKTMSQRLSSSAWYIPYMVKHLHLHRHT